MFLMSNSDWDKYFGRLTEGKLSEDELMMTSVFDFNKFKNEFYQYQKEIFNYTNPFHYPSRKFLKTLPYLKDLADKGQIKVVGVGSSRITFAFSDGKALKCAVNDIGIAQNKREIESIKKSHGHYMCFPSVYEYDKHKYLFLITDCCRSIRKGDIKTLFNVYTNSFFSTLRFIIIDVIGTMIDKNKLKRLKADDILKISIDKINNDINEKIEQSNKLMDNILKQLNKNKNKLSKKKITELTNKKSKVTADLKKYNLKYKNSLKLIQYLIDRNDIKSVQSIKSLIKYYANNGISNLLFDDVQNLENWGLKHIDSNDVPVVIDLGLSDEVASKYYE